MCAAPVRLKEQDNPDQREIRKETYSADERWCAAYTHVKAEKTAAFHLQLQGFESYLPMRRRSIRHARRIYDTTEAFFPRYLFVKLDLKRSQWRRVNATSGVAHLLSLSDRPLTFRPGLVETLQSATGADGILRPADALQPGQRVRILCGSFADYLGRLEKTTRTDAVRVLIEMMDRKVPVYLNRDSVIAI